MKEENKPEEKSPPKNNAPAGKVKMISGGIIRFIPQNRITEYEKKGYVKM